MTGDGTNDAPALAQADVAVAMNTGTQAAKEAGNMVDLDSNPTKLIEIVEIGKQMLMTRGALTTFSIANDVAKYFAIIPAAFVGDLPGARGAERDGPALAASAILSAVIFNALIIVALIPLALRGVRYRPAPAPRCCAATCSSTASAASAAVPCIKLIDLALTALGVAEGTRPCSRTLSPRALLLAPAHPAHRRRLPARRHRASPRRRSPPGQRQPDRARRGRSSAPSSSASPSTPRYFWGRPSATAPTPTTARPRPAPTSGPSNPALHEAVAAASRRCARRPGNARRSPSTS
jgi:hypothetical protein